MAKKIINENIITVNSPVKIVSDHIEDRVCKVVYIIGDAYYVAIPGYGGHYPYGLESLVAVVG